MSPLRLVFAIVFLVIALFVFVPAPVMFLWQVKLVAIEYGHWMVLGPLVVICLGRRRSVVDSVSVGMAVFAAILFLSSGIHATMYASQASGKMNSVFPAPGGTKKGTPFSLFKMWFGSKPQAVEVQTFDFTEHEGKPLRLDFYRAPGRAEAPCVVTLHGGGWENGDRKEFATMNHHLARIGYHVAAVEYRLAPKWTWPSQREDVSAALSYLKSHASELGIDPQRFVLFGRSAGGQLAECLAAMGGNPEVVGCIGFSAPADMKFAYGYADTKDILNSKKLLEQYLGGTLTEVPQRYDEASAPLLANPRSAPTLLIHGNRDELVWVKQSQRYADVLSKHQVKNVFLRLPWATHAFDHNFNGPSGQIAAWAVERFLASVTAPKP